MGLSLSATATASGSELESEDEDFLEPSGLALQENLAWTDNL